MNEPVPLTCCVTDNMKTLLSTTIKIRVDKKTVSVSHQQFFTTWFMSTSYIFAYLQKHYIMLIMTSKVNSKLLDQIFMIFRSRRSETACKSLTGSNPSVHIGLVQGAKQPISKKEIFFLNFPFLKKLCLVEHIQQELSLAIQKATLVLGGLDIGLKVGILAVIGNMLHECALGSFCNLFDIMPSFSSI